MPLPCNDELARCEVEGEVLGTEVVVLVKLFRPSSSLVQGLWIGRPVETEVVFVDLWSPGGEVVTLGGLEAGPLTELWPWSCGGELTLVAEARFSLQGEKLAPPSRHRECRRLFQDRAEDRPGS